MRKLTNRKLDYLIKDEAKAAAEYKALGFPALAGDEARHRKYLIKYKSEFGAKQK